MPKGFRGRTVGFAPMTVADAGGMVTGEHGPLIAALATISRIAHDAPSVEVGLTQTLEAVCSAIEWPIGHVYHLADSETPVLSSAAIWYLEGPERFGPFQLASEQTTFRPGRGLVGLVLAQGRAGLSPDVSRDVRFLRRRAAIETGVRAWLAFPVVAEGRVVAVCECFTTERVVLDPSLAGLLSCAGLALGHLYARDRWNMERARLLEQLAHYEAKVTDTSRADLSALAGAIAHEINSPLFAARASLALLGADQPGEPLLDSAQHELGRIAATLETLHALAQEAPLGQRLPAVGDDG